MGVHHVHCHSGGVTEQIDNSVHVGGPSGTRLEFGRVDFEAFAGTECALEHILDTG